MGGRGEVVLKIDTDGARSTRANGFARDRHKWQVIDSSIGGRWESDGGWDVRAKLT